MYSLESILSKESCSHFRLHSIWVPLLCIYFVFLVIMTAPSFSPRPPSSPLSNILLLLVYPLSLHYYVLQRFNCFPSLRLPTQQPLLLTKYYNSHLSCWAEREKAKRLGWRGAGQRRLCSSGSISHQALCPLFSLCSLAECQLAEGEQEQ